MAIKPTYEELEQRIKELESHLEQMEETLRVSAERNKLATSAAKVGVWDWNIKTGDFYLDPNIKAILGYTDDEIPNDVEIWVKYVHPEDSKAVMEAAQACLDGKTSEYIFEHRMLHKDGSIRWVLVRGKAIRDESGNAVRLIGTDADITDRKQVEETLQESEERLSSFMNSASDSMYLLDSDLNFVEVNKRGLEIIGKKREEVVGKNITDIVPDVKESGRYEKHLEVIKTGKPFEIDHFVPHPIFGDLHFILKSFKVSEGLGVIASDITEHRQAEEALLESERRYRTLFNNTPVGIGVATKQGRALAANDALLQMTGYQEAELDQISLTELYQNPEDRDLVMKQLKTDGFIHSFEIQFIRKDGKPFYGSITITPFPIENKEAHLMVMVDVTQRKQAEDALRESEEKIARYKKMESLGLLAGGVAHDLNNILAGIVSYPELLLLDLPEESKYRKPIETMQESGHRAVAIVQDLLTVARGVAITKEPLNLNDLIGDYLISPEFKKLKEFHPAITIKLNLDSNLLNITGSHVHIRKVIMNLVSNASEAIEGSGNVMISTMNRYIDRPLKGYDDVDIGEYVVLSVSDDGLGISSDELERIFDPFYTKKVLGRSGTGLGLTVVWNVVQDHEGYIDVTTDENGTTFELFFPITREKIPSKDLAITIEDFKGDGETILVVDDVESQRDISCKMLGTFGYKTKAVSSGEEAVEYLKENNVDLILLDMIMDPGINGRETYERIVKIHPKQKAIIVSGFAETDDVKEAQRLGAGQYIKKPLTLEKIGLAIKEELEK